METIVQNAQLLVYSLLGLMPSPYQKASLEAQLAQILHLFNMPVSAALRAAETGIYRPRASRADGKCEWCKI